MFNYNPSVNQLPLSMSLIVAGGGFGKFRKFLAALRYWSSSAKVSSNILMFLPIFDASMVAVQLPAAVIILKRGECVANFSPCDTAPNAAIYCYSRGHRCKI